MDAFISNASAHRADRPVLLSDADLHDLQRLAVLCRGVGRRYRLLSVRMEEVSDRGRYGTLSLAFSKKNHFNLIFLLNCIRTRERAYDILANVRQDTKESRTRLPRFAYQVVVEAGLL